MALAWLALPGCAQHLSHQEAWRAFAAATPLAVPEVGAEVWLEAGLLPGQRFAVVRLDSEAALQVHSSHHNGHPPQAIDAWAAMLGPPAVAFNGGFYGHDGKHVGLARASGTWLTAQAEPSWCGVLLSGPTEPNLANVALVDACKLPGGPRGEALAALMAPYQHVVQSMMLFDDDQALRTRPSALRAARTGLGIDHHGRLVVVLSEGGITLPEFAEAMQAPCLQLARAINLDGGFESQLAVTRQDLSLVLWSRHGSRKEVPDAIFSRLAPRALPTVLFARPRGQHASVIAP